MKINQLLICGTATILFLFIFYAFVATFNLNGTKSRRSKSKRHAHFVVPDEKVDCSLNKTTWWPIRPIVIESHKLVYFEVSKVGSTMWKKMSRRMMGYKDWHTTDPHSLGDLRFLDQYDESQATEFMNSPDYVRFIFVRDPKDRVLSAFLNKIVKDYDKYGKHQEKWCCSSDELCPERFRTFPGFLDVISSCKNQCCSNPHWRPQSWRINEKYCVRLDFVGHLETAHDDAKYLLQRIGAWETYGATGWGKYGNESFLETKSDAGHNTDAEDHRAKYYTPALERLVENMYAADYSTFNLPKTNITYT